MYSDPDFEPPVNPIAPVIILLVLAMVLVEGALSLAEAGIVGGRTGIGWRIGALQDYGISPLVLDVMVTRSDYSFDLLRRFVTYPFVHGDFTHALFCMALLLALGKFVGDTFGSLKTLAVFVGSAVFGGLVFCLLARDSSALFGGYPPVFGLIGVWVAVWQRAKLDCRTGRVCVRLWVGDTFGAGRMGCTVGAVAPKRLAGRDAQIFCPKNLTAPKFLSKNFAHQAQPPASRSLWSVRQCPVRNP